MGSATLVDWHRSMSNFKLIKSNRREGSIKLKMPRKSLDFTNPSTFFPTRRLLPITFFPGLQIDKEWLLPLFTWLVAFKRARNKYLHSKNWTALSYHLWLCWDVYSINLLFPVYIWSYNGLNSICPPFVLSLFQCGTL